MRDITKISNEELLAMQGGQVNVQPDITQISNEELMGMAGRQPVAQEQGFFGKTAEALRGRGAQLADIVQATREGEQTGLEGAVQKVGTQIGALGDIIGQGVVSAAATGFEALPAEVQESLTETGRELLASPIGQSAVQALQGGMESWEAFKSANPRAARNIEATVNIGAFFVPIKGVSAAGTTKALGKAGVEVLETGLEKAAELPGRAASKLLKINPAAADVFETAGVKQSLAGISDAPSVKLFDKFLSKFPGASGQMQKNSDEVLATIENTLERAGGLKGVSPQEAGEIIQTGGKNYVKRFQRASNFLFDRLDKKIPKDTNVSASNTLSLMDDIQFTDDVFGKEASGIVGAMSERATEGSLPYEKLRKFRTLVGNKLSKSFLIGGEDEAALKKLYGKLTDDLKIAADEAGAAKEFNKANQFYSKHISEIESQLQKVIQKDAPEQVFQAATSGVKLGGTRINQIMKSLKPSEREIVRGTLIKRLGQAAPGQQGAVGDVFSSNKFLTEWNKLAPEAKKAIFGSKTETRQALDDVAEVAERIKDIDRFGNPSGTAQQMTLGALIVGGAIEPLSVASGIAGANVAARLMTNDNFLKWMGKHAKKRLTQKTMGAAIKGLNNVAKKDPIIASDIAQYIAIMSSIGGGE